MDKKDVNIFEGAKFGDMYRTAPEPEMGYPEGRGAIFSHLCEDETGYMWAMLYLERSCCLINVSLDGMYFDWLDGKQRFWDFGPQPFIVGRKEAQV